ncbi:hypothetical protein TWF730_005807 [Orbilia blumenaviensis]|uniref:Uncharacterized protein n=1 Tax=Orbilia blumenaviensis TaxID=1796055 RepID=A0AAV9VJG9_9PEZI
MNPEAPEFDLTNTPPGAPSEKSIFLFFREPFKGATTVDANVFRVCKRLEEIPSSDVEKFCVSTNIGRSRLIDILIQLCASGAFDDMKVAAARFPELDLREGQGKDALGERSIDSNGKTGALEKDTNNSCRPDCQPQLTSLDHPSDPAQRNIVCDIDNKPMGNKFLELLGHTIHKRQGRRSVFDISPQKLSCTNATNFKPPSSGGVSLLPKENGGNGIPSSILAKIPNLSPVQLPYPAQHMILTLAQSILEKSCHTFIRKWDPKGLISNEFTHCENAELPKWINLTLHKLPSLPEKSIDKTALSINGGPPLTIDALSTSLSQMRHTAVHRLRTPSGGLEYLLLNAVIFAKFLKDDEERVEKLQYMLDTTISLTGKLERKMNTSKENLSRELVEIEETRNEIDRWERMALLKILADDKTTRDFITPEVEEALQLLGEWKAEMGFVKRSAALNHCPNKLQKKTVLFPPTSESASISRLTLTRLGKYWTSLGHFFRNGLDDGEDYDGESTSVIRGHDNGLRSKASMEIFYSQSF